MEINLGPYNPFHVTHPQNLFLTALKGQASNLSIILNVFANQIQSVSLIIKRL